MRTDLRDLATRYAAAWSSQDPGRLAAFYADSGILAPPPDHFIGALAPEARASDARETS